MVLSRYRRLNTVLLHKNPRRHLIIETVTKPLSHFVEWFLLPSFITVYQAAFNGSVF